MEVISHVTISTCLTCKLHLRSIWVEMSYCSQLMVTVIKCWNVDRFLLSLLLLTLEQVRKTIIIQSNTGTVSLPTILSYCDGLRLCFLNQSFQAFLSSHEPFFSDSMFLSMLVPFCFLPLQLSLLSVPSLNYWQFSFCSLPYVVFLVFKAMLHQPPPSSDYYPTPPSLQVLAINSLHPLSLITVSYAPSSSLCHPIHYHVTPPLFLLQYCLLLSCLAIPPIFL